jgi:hypothetical protein
LAVIVKNITKNLKKKKQEKKTVHANGNDKKISPFDNTIFKTRALTITGFKMVFLQIIVDISSCNWPSPKMTSP